MKCKLCGEILCEHARLSIHDNKVECIDCGEIGFKIPPIKYALPFYEDEVNWNHDIYFPVCKGCYYKHTKDPRAWTPKFHEVDLEHVRSMWESGGGMINNPIKGNLPNHQ